MNIMKKIICSILVVVLCITAAPLQGFVELDFKVEAIDYKVGDIIQFGSYPQSEVKDEVVIEKLNSIAPAWDEWISYGYYSDIVDYGTMVQGDWMRYIDITYNGKKYRGVKFTQYRPLIPHFTSSAADSNQDDNGYYTNIVYWFTYEPINWRILNPETGMVLSESILDSQPYNNCILSSGTDEYGFEAYWGDTSKTYYANNYANSSIRQWLNDDFYNTAFSKTQQKIIESTTIDNLANDNYYSIYDSVSTNDKIYLLSWDDSLNKHYGFSSSDRDFDVARRAKGSDYAQSQGLYVLRDTETLGNGNSFWLLRSPSYRSLYCCHVNCQGRSNDVYSVHEIFGVRPAMCIDLDAVTSSKVFPEGYDFEEDSYNFENYLDKVSEKYFTTLYEEASGMQLYNEEKEKNKHGVCFGMAYTTAAFYMGYPAVDNVYHLGDSVVAETISDIYRGFEMSIGDNRISADDYIKYAYIYQWSAEMAVMSVNSLKETLKDYIEQDMVGVVLHIRRYRIDDNGDYVLDEDGEKIGEGGHAVLAVGIEEIDGKTIIYVDDSNSKDKLQTVTLHENGNWEFSNPWTDSVGLKEVSNRNSTLEYSVDIHAPYRILLTGNKTVKSDDDSNSEIYIEGMDRVDADKVLLNINADNYRIINEDYCKIENDFSGSSKTTTKNDLYWISTDKTVKVSDLTGDNNNVSLSGDNTTITANVTNSSSVTMTIDESNIEANIGTEFGKESLLSFETIVTDGNYNNVKTAVTVKGIADGDEITAVQTETGLEVTGISDGTITLTKDDEVIATQTITDAESNIEINYDKNGGSDSLEVEYETHTHTYTSDVVKEASCTENGICTYTCYCGDTKTETIDANGHTDSEWIVDKDSTCSSEGSKHIECTVCEEVLKTDSIEKLPHKYNSTITKPTCENGGYTTYTCTCGNTYTGDKTSAKGHDYVEGVCKNCGDRNIDNCSCSCHKGGIAGFFFKIILFFQKIFKTNKTCSCGVAHY